MGKGKGAISRYGSRVPQNHNLLEFTGFNLHEVARLKKILSNKINIPLKITSLFFKKKNTIIYKKNENFFSLRRYHN